MGAHHDHRGAAHHAGRGRLRIALGLILALMVAEVAAGIAASSLALLSDAAHMVTDAGALVLSLVALRLAARPARGPMTFGLKRAEILSAQLNGATLAILAAFIVYEGVRRLASPPDVEGALVVVVALLGVAVTFVATATLAGADRRSLNVEGSFQHILTDMYAFAATAAAGAVVLATGFDRADAIASLVVAALMFRAAWALIRDSGRVLLEGAPVGVDPDEIGRALLAHPQVVEVHDLHVWEVTSGFPALSAHVLVSAEDDCHEARRELEEILRARFDIEHSTLQMEHATTRELLAIDTPRPSSP